MLNKLFKHRATKQMYQMIKQTQISKIITSITANCFNVTVLLKLNHNPKQILLFRSSNKRLPKQSPSARIEGAHYATLCLDWQRASNSLFVLSKFLEFTTTSQLWLWLTGLSNNGTAMNYYLLTLTSTVKLNEM